jgi:hypothetical protein
MLAMIRCRISFLSVCCPSVKVKIYRIIILPVVLCGCETWLLTFGWEHMLRVFENRVLRIFGPKKNEVTGELKILHNEELFDLYSSPIFIWMIKSWFMTQAGHAANKGEENFIQGFGGES